MACGVEFMALSAVRGGTDASGVESIVWGAVRGN
jgi:hypothetical protein